MLGTRAQAFDDAHAKGRHVPKIAFLTPEMGAALFEFQGWNNDSFVNNQLLRGSPLESVV